MGDREPDAVGDPPAEEEVAPAGPPDPEPAATAAQAEADAIVDIKRIADDARPAIVAGRQAMRACITRWTNDYKKYIRDNDELIKAWGPDEYTWFATLHTGNVEMY